MSKNFADLNEILFKQLERVSDPQLKGDMLDAEIKRTEAVCKISGQVIGSANTVLSAMRLKDNAMDATLKLPAFIGE